MARREDDRLGNMPERVSSQRIHLCHGVDVLAEILDSEGLFVTVGRNDLKGVAADAERSAVKVNVVTLVMHFHEALHERFHGEMLPFFHGNDQFRVVLWRTETVDAGDGGHDNHVPARQESVRGGMAQLVDIVVDGRVLGDVRVGSGHVGFGLIEVVIADEVLDRVIGEEGPEF